MFDIEPITPAIGAEVRGVDLSAAIGETLAADLRAALARHFVLVFREQDLDIAAQKRVTAAFGPLFRVPYVEPLAEDGNVIAVHKEADETNISVFGGDWHSDFSFLERPPAGSVLYALDVPPAGGDTLWASQAAAWRHLPDDLKGQVEGRRAVHTGAPYGVTHAPPPDMQVTRSIRMTRGDPEADRETLHPVVRHHPDTGEPALFVNPIYTTRFEDADVAGSRPLLRRLYDHAVRPEFCCRLRWAPGTLAVWDNRMTLHYAVNDYDGHRRLLHRTTFAGERPA